MTDDSTNTNADKGSNNANSVDNTKTKNTNKKIFIVSLIVLASLAILWITIPLFIQMKINAMFPFEVSYENNILNPFKPYNIRIDITKDSLQNNKSQNKYSKIAVEIYSVMFHNSTQQNKLISITIDNVEINPFQWMAYLDTIKVNAQKNDDSAPANYITIANGEMKLQSKKIYLTLHSIKITNKKVLDKLSDNEEMEIEQETLILDTKTNMLDMTNTNTSINITNNQSEKNTQIKASETKLLASIALLTDIQRLSNLNEQQALKSLQGVFNYGEFNLSMKNLTIINEGLSKLSTEEFKIYHKDKDISSLELKNFKIANNSSGINLVKLSLQKQYVGVQEDKKFSLEINNLQLNNLKDFIALDNIETFKTVTTINKEYTRLKSSYLEFKDKKPSILQELLENISNDLATEVQNSSIVATITVPEQPQRSEAINTSTLQLKSSQVDVKIQSTFLIDAKLLEDLGSILALLQIGERPTDLNPMRLIFITQLPKVQAWNKLIKLKEIQVNANNKGIIDPPKLQRIIDSNLTKERFHSAIQNVIDTAFPTKLNVEPANLANQLTNYIYEQDNLNFKIIANPAISIDQLLNN